MRASGSNLLLVNGERRLTPRESLRLMGFPDTFKVGVSDGQVKKQAGNGVCVPVVKAIADEMVHTLALHIDQGKVALAAIGANQI